MSLSAPRFTHEADAALEKLYAAFGATEVEQKINVLKSALNMKVDGDGKGGPNFYALGGQIDDDMKLGCLEYEYLGSRGLIKLELA